MDLAEILAAVIGPYGGLILAVVVIWFLYRLYREERRDGRTDRESMGKMADAVVGLTAEVRSLREGMDRK